MNLRGLKLKDADRMLAWMHDEYCVRDLMADFLEKTIDDCIRFIQKSWSDEKNMHLAIVNEKDEYLGTVSLKNIENDTAEFAITIRREAMGKGIARDAMKRMIQKGFDKGVKKIYWCVLPDNTRALRFYDKNGYQRINYEKLPTWGSYCQKQVYQLIWYLTDKSISK